MKRFSAERFSVLALGVTFLLCGCGASDNASTDPTYVPAGLYDNYTCDQLHVQMNLTQGKITDLSDEEDGKNVMNAVVSAYASSQGYGFDDRRRQESENAVELRRQKNKYDVLEETAVRKSCLHVNHH